MMVDESGKCQYCGGPSPNSYTCMECTLGWPRDKCKCENNGDYCDACFAWIEQRREVVAEAEMEQ
jgi:hypothetical protein